MKRAKLMGTQAGLVLIILAMACAPDLSSIEIEAEQAEPEILEREADPVSEFLTAFESYFSLRLREADCPGAAVVIVKDSVVVHLRGYGLQSAYGRDSINAGTVFRIASLSKGFTAVLAAILVDKGYFKWDDKVTRYLPDFALRSPTQTEALRIYHLLSHTSGLPIQSYSNLIEAGLSISHILSQLRKVPLAAGVGERYHYQNAAFAAIEKIIEQCTGKAYTTVLREELFEPLGLRETSSSFEEIISRTNVAQPHQYSSLRGAYVPVDITEKYYNTVSAGGINTSIRDMGQWLKLLLGNRPDIISQAGLSHIFKPVVTTRWESAYFNKWHGTSDSHYALGWRVLDFDDRQIIHHGGFVNSYRGEIAIDPERKLGIAILFNAPCDFSGYVVPAFIYYDELYGERPAALTTGTPD